MAKKSNSFLSPAVYTNEIDASFLPPAPAQTGACIIGKATKGPAFVPISVRDFSEYTEYFGDLTEKYYMGYGARAYLKNQGLLNVVRVLGPAGTSANGTTVSPGYTADKICAIVGLTGTTTAVVLGVLEVTGTTSVAGDLVIKDLGNDLFMVHISSSNRADNWCYTTASFFTSSEYYVRKVLNTDPTKFQEKGYYLRDTYDFNYFKLQRDAASTGHAIYSSESYGLTNFAEGYNSGSTPWINSQIFGNSSDYNLFRVHTLGHGEVENGRFKIGIRNIKVSPVPGINEFGTFDLEVRSFYDTDKNPIVYEKFEGLSMNPSDLNYVAKRVGDRHWEYNQTKDKMVSYGNYNNNSKLVFVEMTTGSYPDTALPWGFRGLAKPNMMYTTGSEAPKVTSQLATGAIANAIGDLPYVSDLYDKETQGDIKSYIYWGVEFDLSGSVLGRLSKYPTMTASDTDFSLRWVSGSSETAAPGAGATGLRYLTTLGASSQKQPGDTTAHAVLGPDVAKFTVPIAFGFDGWDRRIQDPLDNVTQLASVTQIGVQALRLAVDILGDKDYISTNLITIPGIYSSKVVEYCIDKVEERADCFYIADLMNHSSSATSVTTTLTQVKGRGFDTNYAAIYYPGIKAVDNVNNKIVELPSSVAAFGAMAYSDRVSYPWYAPAGMNRGGLNSDTIGFTVTEAIDRLTSDERDDLYENRINPIASFPGEGIMVWGQKTLQAKASALDRINVRRLLIAAKKLVSVVAKQLVFEPNNSSTWTRFKQMVNPILADIQQKNGLEKFLVVMDSNLNTPDVIDRNIMKGQIWLVPTRTAEYISLDFIVSRSGVTFAE
jgi:hypothetical protein